MDPVDDPVRRPAAKFLGKEPSAASVKPRRAHAQGAAQLRYPQADAAGRHPSCPARAPYGQLVDTDLGRKMVRCVIRPSLFVDDHGTAQVAVAEHAARVQVGSFAVPGNARRLVARLSARGLPAKRYRSGGLMVVMAGPFSGSAAAQKALLQVRDMGFADAFLRR